MEASRGGVADIGEKLREKLREDRIETGWKIAELSRPQSKQEPQKAQWQQERQARQWEQEIQWKQEARQQQAQHEKVQKTYSSGGSRSSRKQRSDSSKKHSGSSSSHSRNSYRLSIRNICIRSNRNRIIGRHHTSSSHVADLLSRIAANNLDIA